jgi:hypothetical protein
VFAPGIAEVPPPVDESHDGDSTLLDPVNKPMSSDENLTKVFKL